MNYVLVDDEERALKLLRIMITRFDGFSKENDHIYTFTQPVEALDFIRRTLVDVVFLDIEMPMLNGITLGKQISEELPAPPEIIYVTAFPEYSLDAWDIGAFGYILKPYDPKSSSAVSCTMACGRQSISFSGARSPPFSSPMGVTASSLARVS